MKVSLITLHRVTNFGSLLQTLATQIAISKLGYEIEVIDFVPEGLSFYRAVWPKKRSVVSKVVKFVPLFVCNFFQYRMVNSFLSKYVNLTTRRYSNIYDLKRYCPLSDIYLSGSDQIWNTQNNNPEEDLGAYYLDFTDSSRKIGYAGSFGRDDFSKNELRKMKKCLESYKKVSVREYMGLDVLKKMGISGVHVVDPTLLLTKEEWKQSLPIYGCSERYIFVYNLNRNKLIEEIAVEISKKMNIKIVNFADTFEFIKGARNRLNNNPIDFVSFISQAELVITDSFHGVAFSINFERQFICVPPPKYECRLISILESFRCEDRMVHNLFEALEVWKNNIDYRKVTELVDIKRQESLLFLAEALAE